MFDNSKWPVFTDPSTAIQATIKRPSLWKLFNQIAEMDVYSPFLAGPIVTTRYLFRN